MAFWNDSSVEPKRGFRWLLYLENPQGGFETYVVRDVTKPAFTISETPVKYIAHTFKYPGRLTWNNVTVNLIDPIVPDTSAILTRILQSSGYKLPETEEAAKFAFSKRTASNALGTPRLEQIDAGITPLAATKDNPARRPMAVEEWSLVNAWVSAVTFGSLNYTNEELVAVQLTIIYDYAMYQGDFDGKQLSPVMYS